MKRLTPGRSSPRRNPTSADFDFRIDIKDRQGAALFAEGVYGHRNVIYNAVPIYMADKQKDLDAIDLRGRHMMFTVESRKECAQIIDAFKKGTAASFGIKRIAK